MVRIHTPQPLDPPGPLMAMTYTVYILRTSANTLYIGQTNNLDRRLKEHQEKTIKSAKYVKYFTAFKLVHAEAYETRQESMKREWQLKQWPRAKKEALITGNKIILRQTLKHLIK